MFTNIPWRFLMIETFVVGALCCICTYEHPQSHFCKHGFVLRVRIREEIKVLITKAFWVEIKKVFKGDVRELTLIQNRSVILEMHQDCPVDSLKTGDKYVIFGDNWKGNIYTIDCYGNLPWEKTTLLYRHGLAKYYKDNCDCIPKHTEMTTQRYCKSYYSLMKKRGNECKWIKPRHFLLCEKGLLNRPY